MANSATKMTPLSIFLPGGACGYVKHLAYPVRINYDTTGADLQISAVTGKSIWLVGLELVKGAAYNLIFKSASTQLIKYELAANSGRVEPFNPSVPRIICNTEPGEGLNLNCDVALPLFLLYIVEV